MRQILKILVAAIMCVGAMPASAQLATERYIPIGDSPGISGIKSYVGEIRSLDADGFAMRVGNGDKAVRVTEKTRIYLDLAGKRSNRLGSEEDCQVGRLVEVYLHDDGTAYWVKIRMP